MRLGKDLRSLFCCLAALALSCGESFAQVKQEDESRTAAASQESEQKETRLILNAIASALECPCRLKTRATISIDSFTVGLSFTGDATEFGTQSVETTEGRSTGGWLALKFSELRGGSRAVTVACHAPLTCGNLGRML
jgi:hypothetical protein